jgi:hypothetical protein
MEGHTWAQCLSHNMEFPATIPHAEMTIMMSSLGATSMTNMTLIIATSHTVVSNGGSNSECVK